MVFSAFGEEKAIQIDRLHAIREIALEISGQVTFSGGSASGAVVGAIGSWISSFIKSIRLTVGGGTTLFNGTGRDLFLVNYMKYRTKPNFSNIADGTAAARPFSMYLVIPFEEPLAPVKVDPILLSQLFASLELRVQIGQKGDLIDTDNDRTCTFNSTNIKVHVFELVNAKQPFGAVTKKYSFNETAITASNTELPIILPVGNILKDVVIYTTAVTKGEDALSDSILNNIKFQIGGEVVYDATKACNQGELKNRFTLETVIAGVHMVTFNPDQILSEGLNLSRIGALNANILLDVTNTGTTPKARVMFTEYTPVA